MIGNRKGLDNRTVGDPNWHGRGTDQYGAKCAALDPRKYALPGDSDQWRPKEDGARRPRSSGDGDCGLELGCTKRMLLFFWPRRWRSIIITQ